MLYIDIGGKL